MKFLQLLCATTLLAVGPLLATEETDTVQAGDSMQKVIDILGRPQGVAEMGSKQVMFFDRGEVVLEDGKVAKVDILTAEAHSDYLDRREETRRVSQEQAEARRQQRIERGEAQKASKLSDPVFLSATADVRLRYWSKFRRSYPEVDISQQLDQALDEFEADTKRQEQERRILELEARVRMAEAKAERSERRRYYSFPPYYGGGIYINRGHQTRRHYRHGLPSHSRVHYIRHGDRFHHQRPQLPRQCATPTEPRPDFFRGGSEAVGFRRFSGKTRNLPRTSLGDPSNKESVACVARKP